METFVRLSAYTGRNLPVVQAVQGDTNRVIIVEIKEFESLEGTTCRLVAMRPLGTDAKIDGTIDGGRVSFDLTDAITMSGDIYAQVQVTEGNNRVSTFDFVLQVAESREAMATAKEIYWVEDFIGKEGQKVDELIQTKGTAFDEMQQQKETAFDQFASAASDRFEEFIEGADQAVDNLIDTTTGRVNSFLESAVERVSEAVQTIPELVDNKFAEKLAEIDGKVSEASGYASAAETAKNSAESAKTAAKSASEASQASANAAQTSASEAANSASQAASAVESAIVPLQQRIAKVESVNHRQQIEIDLNTAFRRDKYSIEVEDSSVAYTKDVPSGALPWAEVKSVGGMSFASINKLNPSWAWVDNSGYYSNGVRYTYDSEKIITLNGEKTSVGGTLGLFRMSNLANGEYTAIPFSIDGKIADSAFDIGCNGTSYTRDGKAVKFTVNGSAPNAFIVITVAVGTVCDNAKVGIVVCKTSEATYFDHYIPYNPNLISSNLSEIESSGTEGVIGSKVFPSAIASQMHGINDSVYDEVELVPTVYPNMEAIDLGSLEWSYNSVVFSATVSDIKPPSTDAERNKGLLSKEYFPDSQVSIGADMTEKSMLKRNTTIFVKDSRYTSAQDFREAVSGVILHYEATEGGEDYEAVVYHKRVGTYTFDGSENISLYQRTTYRYDLAGKAGGLTNVIAEDFITFTNGTHNSGEFTTSKENLVVGIQGLSYLYFNIPNASTVSDAKEFLKGKTVYYELSNPQILDVTEYFPDENYRFIEVEGGGTITFKQDGDYRIAVPSTVEYDVKVGD